MNKVRRQQKRFSLFLVSMVCVFGLNYAFSAQAMIVQNNNFVSEVAMGSVVPSISFGSIDSLYNSLMSKFKNKNVQHVGIACRRSSKQDELVENEQISDEILQEKLLFSFAILQKWLVLSALLLSSVPSIASNNQPQESSAICFNLPSATCARSSASTVSRAMNNSVSCINRSFRQCPDWVQPLAIADISNGISVLIDWAPKACGLPCPGVVSCALSGSIGCVSGCAYGFSENEQIVTPETREFCLNCGPGFASDQTYVSFTSNNPSRPITAVGVNCGNWAGAVAAKIINKHCCGPQQIQSSSATLTLTAPTNSNGVMDQPIAHQNAQKACMNAPRSQHINRDLSSSYELSKFVEARRAVSKPLARSKSFDNVFDKK